MAKKKEADIPFTDKEVAATKRPDPAAFNPQGVLNAQRVKEGWTPAEVAAGKRIEKTQAKQAMEAKFGKDYDKPKPPAVGASKTNTKPEAATKTLPDDSGKALAVLKDENPHKPDSNRAKAFNDLKKAKTIGEWLKKGTHCKYKYLKVWEKAKLIKIG